MVRSAALTLGAALTIGGVSAVQADDLTLPDVASLAAGVPSLLYGVFPSFPENWSDLPVQLRMSESVGYNSNVLGIPLTNNGAITGFGQPIGSFYSLSNFGASTKAYWEGQQFFADVSAGMYRYLADSTLNTLSSSLDAGVNWTYGSKCSGKLSASEQTAPSQPGQQVGFNVKNNFTTIAFNETANCIVSGDYALVLNSGVTNSTNSATVDKFNDFQSEFIAAGITYTVSQTNSLQLLATVTGTNYTSRPITLNSQGLASDITQDQLNATYTKNLSPSLALTASAGVVGVSNGSFNLALPSGLEPMYSLAVTWTATPKLGLSAGVSRSVSPPTSILANLQVTESANLGLTYSLTPKLLLAGGVQVGRSSGAFTPVASASALNSAFAANSNSYSANASINYAMTPFVTANLSYTFTRTVQANFETPTSVVLLALSFNPY